MQAVEQLVNRARELATGWSPEQAIAMYEAALRAAPSRGDLYVELAELEFSCGRREEATSRLEALAGAYLDRDMVAEAEAVVAMLEARLSEPEPGAVVPAQTGVTEPMTVVFGVPQVVEVTHTEFCREPILLLPDGTPMPAQRKSPAKRKPRVPRPGRNGKRSKPMVQIVRLSAPALRRPTATASSSQRAKAPASDERRRR